MMTAQIGLVHIVYAPFGLQPLRQFLDSYHRHPAGVDHELILVFKAFGTDTLPEDYRTLLADVAYHPLFVPDGGFDLGSYFLAAKTCEHEFLCFLNSRSVILADGWLAKLHLALGRPGAGLAGATGSFESQMDDLRYRFRLPAGTSRARRFLRFLRAQVALLPAAWGFAEFPNPHLRTNAFLIERQVLLSLKASSFRSKADCYAFENGRRSLTRRVQALGWAVFVVGRDGEAYPAERWQESATFRSGEQENLLVADNQTRQYADANASERSLLARFAWEPTGLD